MNFLLKLKHWQLFLLTWGPGIIVNVFSFSNPMLMIKLFPVTMIFFTLGTLGWIWAIASGLNDKLPQDVKFNIRKFKLLFSIPILYIILITIGISIVTNSGVGTNHEDSFGVVLIFILLHIFSMFCIFYGMAFAAKTLKSIELGRKTKFGDYAGEFMLIWISFIGFWILQPRINQIIK